MIHSSKLLLRLPAVSPFRMKNTRVLSFTTGWWSFSKSMSFYIFCCTLNSMHIVVLLWYVFQFEAFLANWPKKIAPNSFLVLYVLYAYQTNMELCHDRDDMDHLPGLDWNNILVLCISMCVYQTCFLFPDLSCPTGCFIRHIQIYEWQYYGWFWTNRCKITYGYKLNVYFNVYGWGLLPH